MLAAGSARAAAVCEDAFVIGIMLMAVLATVIAPVLVPRSTQLS